MNTNSVKKQAHQADRTRYSDELFIKREFSARASGQRMSSKKTGKITTDRLDALVSDWCTLHGFVRHDGAVILTDSDADWLLPDEFSLADYDTPVFPTYYESFRVYLKGHGLSLDEQSSGTFVIRLCELP